MKWLRTEVLSGRKRCWERLDCNAKASLMLPSSGADGSNTLIRTPTGPFTSGPSLCFRRGLRHGAAESNRTRVTLLDAHRFYIYSVRDS